MNFSEKLIKLCQKKGVAPSRVAVSLGFAASAAMKWKTMSDNPPPATIKKLAEYFEVDVDYFYNDTDTPTPAQDQPQIAFGGGMDDLTPEEFDKVYEYIKYLKSQRK